MFPSDTAILLGQKLCQKEAKSVPIASRYWGKKLRPEEIESPANPWKGLMLPLHHRRDMLLS